jgi:class 3 adenylate cyclase/ubiquinone/menaquinone biosynthesis C-methylase UbiE
MTRTATATVMFTDVVGSTALSARLGVARADDVRHEHFELVRKVLSAHEGEEVKTLGDGVMAVFAGITDAVECAVAIQQAVEVANRARPDALELRIGVSVGELSVESGDYFGPPVIEAARLCADAQPRQILCTGNVRRLAASRCRHVFRPAGRRVLRGLPEPVEVDEVAWVPLVTRGLEADFRHIDEAEEPQEFVGQLDRMRESPFFREVREHVLELLAPRAGECVLDLGSGTGDDVLAIAQRVGPTGRVIGVDHSRTMLDEAERRAKAARVTNVEFRFGNAESLDLEDNSVDGSRSDRTLQYLVEPFRALCEMVRVTRPGGRVVAADTDWETVVMDTDDLELTSRVCAAWCDTRPSGRVGRQLYGFFNRAGLRDVTLSAHTSVLTDLTDSTWRLYQIVASQAVSAGATTEEEASRWLAGIEGAAAERRFLSSFTMFVASGCVPLIDRE